MHECILNTVVTVALVLKHQTINIHGGDQISIVWNQFQTKVFYLQWTAYETKVEWKNNNNTQLF